MSCGILWLWRTFVFRLGGSFLLHQQAWPARFSSCCLQCWWKGPKVFSNTCLNKGEIIYILYDTICMYIYYLYTVYDVEKSLMKSLMTEYWRQFVIQTDWSLLHLFVAKTQAHLRCKKYGPGQRRVKCSGSQACPGRWKWFATTAR